MPSLSARSEEHTSELQSRVDLVCRLLLEKKKNDCLFQYILIIYLYLILFLFHYHLALFLTIYDCFFDINNKRFSLLSFFFNDTATTESYTLSLHDALPI